MFIIQSVNMVMDSDFEKWWKRSCLIRRGSKENKSSLKEISTRSRLVTAPLPRHEPGPYRVQIRLIDAAFSYLFILVCGIQFFSNMRPGVTFFSLVWHNFFGLTNFVSFKIVTCFGFYSKALSRVNHCKSILREVDTYIKPFKYVWLWDLTSYNINM
jgi:hypothetical protein